MADLDAELHRIQVLLQENTVVTANSNLEYGFHKGIFEEVIRSRETIVRFSEQRAILSENPEATVAALLNYYVNHLTAPPQSTPQAQTPQPQPAP